MTATKEENFIDAAIVDEKKELDEVKAKPAAVVKKPRVKPVLKSTLGKEVKEEDYFFGGEAPVWFNKVCGMAVEREDLLEVFNKIFSPNDGFLFYKATNKEVYIIIVPVKYSTVVKTENGSLDGDFQKHAISFINEGSVNLDTLKTKLKRILPFVDFKDR